MKKRLCVLTLLALLSACATGYKPTYYYHEIRVVNNSEKTLSNVNVVVDESGRRISCETIAPLRICQQDYAKIPYRYRPTSIDWTFDEGAPQSRKLIVDVGATMNTSFAMRLMVEISPGGEMSTYFAQDTPL